LAALKAERGAKTMKIPRAMYLDDDADSCEVMQMLLVSSIPGLVVESIMSGSEAIQKANERPFDIYVLDAKIPGIDGFDVCRSIREHDPLVPIYFYTGLGSKADRDLAFEAGCTDFLIKPNDMDELIKRVTEDVSRTTNLSVESSAFGY
jgi:DNA-binding response OmpR family regulator